MYALHFPDPQGWDSVWVHVQSKQASTVDPPWLLEPDGWDLLQRLCCILADAAKRDSPHRCWWIAGMPRGPFFVGTNDVHDRELVSHLISPMWSFEQQCSKAEWMCKRPSHIQNSKFKMLNCCRLRIRWREFGHTWKFRLVRLRINVVQLYQFWFSTWVHCIECWWWWPNKNAYFNPKTLSCFSISHADRQIASRKHECKIMPIWMSIDGLHGDQPCCHVPARQDTVTVFHGRRGKTVDGPTDRCVVDAGLSLVDPFSFCTGLWLQESGCLLLSNKSLRVCAIFCSAFFFWYSWTLGCFVLLTSRRRCRGGPSWFCTTRSSSRGGIARWRDWAQSHTWVCG